MRISFSSGTKLTFLHFRHFSQRPCSLGLLVNDLTNNTNGCKVLSRASTAAKQHRIYTLTRIKTNPFNGRASSFCLARKDDSQVVTSDGMSPRPQGSSQSSSSKTSSRFRQREVYLAWHINMGWRSTDYCTEKRCGNTTCVANNLQFMFLKWSIL